MRKRIFARDVRGLSCGAKRALKFGLNFSGWGLEFRDFLGFGDVNMAPETG